jgi:hypothetical protein
MAGSEFKLKIRNGPLISDSLIYGRGRETGEETMKQNLFDYVVLLHEPKGPNKEIESSILVKPTTVLAPNEEAVRIIASKAIPEKAMGKLPYIEIRVREFADE